MLSWIRKYSLRFLGHQEIMGNHSLTNFEPFTFLNVSSRSEYISGTPCMPKLVATQRLRENPDFKTQAPAFLPSFLHWKLCSPLHPNS